MKHRIHCLHAGRDATRPSSFWIAIGSPRTISVSLLSMRVCDSGLKTILPFAFLMPTMITPVSFRKPEPAKFSPGKTARVGNADLFHLEVQVFPARRDLDEVHHIGTKDRLGHAA